MPFLPVVLAAAEDAVDITTDTSANVAAGGILAGLGVFIVILWIIGIVGFVYWLWMLIDAIKTTDEDYEKAGAGGKVLWIILILLLGLIPAVVYHIMVKSKLKKMQTPAAPAAPAAK